MEVRLVFAQPRQPLGAVVSWELDEVSDVELNQALAAGQDPQAFIVARNVATRLSPGLAPGIQASDGPAMPDRLAANPGPHGTPGREAEADGNADLGMFGPDRPELDDIRAGEEMS